MKAIFLMLVALPLIGSGCDAEVRVGSSIAEAANLPLEPPARLELKRNKNTAPLPFEWGLYRKVYCAEKTGAGLQIEVLLQQAGHTTASWNEKVERNLGQLGKSGSEFQEQWKVVSLTPCP